MRAPALAAAALLAACQVPDVTFSVAPEQCVASPLFAVATNPLAPKGTGIADLNADGRPDIVVADRGNDTISVLIGSATALHPGEFEVRVEYIAGSQPSALALADANGDGKPDALVANAGDGTMSVLLGTGDTDVSFAPQRIVRVGGSPIDLIATDLDGDGKLDVAVLGSDGRVGVLLGNGDATFRAAVGYPAGDGAQQLVVADANGDHVPDLVVLRTPAPGGAIPDGDSAATLLVGKGDGTFLAAVDRDIGASAISLSAAELSGDGAVDLAVVRARTSAVGVLLGTGDGHFTPTADLVTNRQPVAITAADVNGDGKIDLLVVAKHGAGEHASLGALDTMLGNGDGTFQPFIEHFGGRDPILVTAADVNGDHLLDVVTLSDADATVSVIVGEGDGMMTSQIDYPLGTGPAAVVFGDVTDDGETDAVIADQTTAAVAVDVVTADGFVARVQSPTVGTPVAPLIADVDGDGKPDIVAANVDRSSLSIALRSPRLGGPVSLFARAFSLDTAAGPAGVAAGDLDRDGKPDLVVAARDAGMVSVLLGRGGGNFAPRVDYPVGAQPIAIAVANAGAGVPAVVVANRADSTLSVLVANPDGTLRSKVDYPTGPQPVALVVGDVTGDHIDDIVVANFAGRGVTLFAGNGDGSFHPGVDLATGAGPSSVAIVDIDGDGVPDLVVANANGRTLSVLRGNGKGGFAAAIQHPEADRPLTVAIDPKGGGEIGLMVEGTKQNAKNATVGVCVQ